MKRISFVLLIAALLSCTRQSEPVRFSGDTQGTTFSIIYTGYKGSETPDEVIKEVHQLLEEFDLSLSSYNPASLITAINNDLTDSADIYFTEVFEISRQVWDRSGGAFDITAAPLIDAWGFGANSIKSFREELRDSLMALVGMDKTGIKDGRVFKQKGMSFDVNGVAQGYSVDLVAKLLEKKGIENFLVEIGGEVRASGSKNGAAWRVGVDKPIDGNYSSGEYLQAVIELTDLSLATSGNYRRFYIGEDGVKYSHTIDPVTGYPVRNRILSATIISDNCGKSDAWATACMVADIDKAIEYILKNPDLEGYLIYSGENGELLEWVSAGMEKLIRKL